MMHALWIFVFCCVSYAPCTAAAGKRANIAFPLPVFEKLRPRLPSVTSLANSCVTRDGDPGKCMAGFDCPYFRTQAGQNVDKTECPSGFFLKFYCCPSGSPRSNTGPLSKLRVSSCGSRPSTGIGKILSKRATIEQKKIGVNVPLIVGGIEAAANSWPWMTAIYTKNRGRLSFLCGGAIINNRYILTAAHCFKTRKDSIVSPGSFVVRLAEHNLGDTTKGSEYAVEAIVAHEDYSPPVDYNDIALIKLKQPIRFHDKVQPICLPLGNAWTQSSLLDKLSTVIGWGVTSFAGRDSATLRQVNVPIASSAACDTTYRRLRAFKDYPNGIIESQMCAGFRQGGKDACQGDSGGPLMMTDRNGKWNLAGIISGGFQCARPNIPGVYTRVSHFLPWIARNLN